MSIIYTALALALFLVAMFLFFAWLTEVYLNSYPVYDGKPQSLPQRVRFWFSHRHHTKHYDNVWQCHDGTFVNDQCRPLGEYWQEVK